ncbi:MAG: hypothetical protein R3284_12095 [Rubricoccaceae bacterium]|nr:hypothetical protein [Rubricoccaceae bacterium]
MKFKADFRRLAVITAALIATAMLLTPPAFATPFHVLTEGDPGTSGNVRIRSFNSLADLISLNQSSTSLLGSNLGGTGVSIGGFTYDGNQYHVLTEGDPGGSGNVRIRSFNSLADLISLNQASTSLLGSNLGGTGVSIGGFTAVPTFVAVPLPATIWMFLISLCGLGLLDWRRRRVTA